MTRLTLAALALITATGCGTFVPTAGTYEMSGISLSENSCGLDEPDADESESYVFTVDEEALTAQVDLDDDYVFDCTLEDEAMACDDIVFEQDSEDYAIDQIFSFGGTFVDEVTLDGSYGITMTCEGEGCAELEAEAGFTLPCTTTFAFTAATAAAQ